MSKEIRIETFYQDPSTPFSEIIEVLHLSFKERLEQNLQFTCATISVNKYKKHVINSHIFVAYNNENRIIATAILTEKNKYNIKYGNFEYLAIHPENKRLGLGTLLFNEIQKFAIKNNFDCITSSTATKATSSVKFHKKMGYKIFKYDAYPETNYYSYCFIKPLKNCCKINCILLLRPLLLLTSYIKCKLKYKR